MCLKKKKNYSDAIVNVIRKNNALTYIMNGFNKINKTIKSVTSPLHLKGINNYIQVYENVALSKINSIRNEDTRDWLREVLIRQLNSLEKLQDEIVVNMVAYAKMEAERINKEIEHDKLRR